MDNFSKNVIYCCEKVCFANLSTVGPILSSKNHSIATAINLNLKPKIEHLYRKIFPWSGNSELSKYIINNNVIYRSGSLVAINKPYGLAIKSPAPADQQGKKKVVQTLNTALCSNYTGDLTQILPLLAKELGVERLSIVKTPERFNSGVALLSADDESEEKIRKCFRTVQSLKRPCEEYFAVTVGVPIEKSGAAKVGLVLQTSESSGIKQAIITETASHKSIQCGKSKYVMVKHETLSVNNAQSASLVRISVSSTTWHFLRVFLASLLSPVLGDNVHGSRVAFQGMQPKSVNPFSHLAQLPQELPPALMAALGMPKGQQAIIPVHLHLSKLTIPAFGNKKEDLVIEAPLTDTFLWTCQKLGLELP